MICVNMSNTEKRSVVITETKKTQTTKIATLRVQHTVEKSTLKELCCARQTPCGHWIQSVFLLHKYSAVPCTDWKCLLFYLNIFHWQVPMLLRMKCANRSGKMRKTKEEKQFPIQTFDYCGCQVTTTTNLCAYFFLLGDCFCC